MTWLRLFWIFFVPLLAVLPAFIPEFAGRALGGLYRQGFVQTLVDVLPQGAAGAVATWFAATSLGGELLIVFLIILNLTAVAAWPLWLIGEGIIRLSNWVTTTNMGQLRKGLRRS